MCPSRRGCSPNLGVRRISSAERRFFVPLDHPEFITAHNENADSPSMSRAPKQSPTSGNATGTTPFTFHAAGHRQVKRAASGVAKYAGNYENQMVGIVGSSGSRVTMAYNANFRCTDNWS